VSLRALSVVLLYVAALGFLEAVLRCFLELMPLVQPAGHLPSQFRCGGVLVLDSWWLSELVLVWYPVEALRRDAKGRLDGALAVR
jgi:hypothetical protein